MVPSTMKILHLLLLASQASANVIRYAEASATPTIVTTTSSPDQVHPRDNSLPPACVTSAMAIPGDTCESFAAKHGISSVFWLLNMNPQIGGKAGCPSRLWAYNYYCIGNKPAPTTWATKLTYAPAPTTTNPPPPPPPPPTTLIPVIPVPTPPPPTPHPICPINNCWRAFALATSRYAQSQSAWCSSITSTMIQESVYAHFPGAGPLVQMQCGYRDAPPADQVLSAMCSCYNAGNMLATIQPGACYDGPPTYGDGFNDKPRDCKREVGLGEVDREKME